MSDTIVAVATPPGRGGVGIVRVSGGAVATIAQAVLGFMPKPRYAHHSPFLAADGQQLDVGIALFFLIPILSQVRMFLNYKGMVALLSCSGCWLGFVL